MEPLPQELLNLEQQLRAFAPQAPQTSREQLLYQAGWEAALAQHAAPTAASPAVPLQKSFRQSNYYWAAACAALLLLSTALGWQVWQQPQPESMPIMTTSVPTKQQSATHPTPALAITVPAYEPLAPRSAEAEPSTMASYLDLRQRVTRGGLSMWPVSTPVQANLNDAAQTPARDWQAELLRESL